MKMAGRLIARGANINYQNSSPFGRTALHMALMKRFIESVNFLMSHKDINPHLEDYSGRDSCYYSKLLPETMQR